MKTCETCEHWRSVTTKDPTIGRCAQRVRAALAVNMTVPFKRVNQWTNPNDTCDYWEPRE